MATDEIHLKVKTMLQVYDVTVNANSVVNEVMEQLVEIAEVPVRRQKLIKMKNNRPTQPMDPTKTLLDYGITDGDKIFLIVMSVGFEQVLSQETEFYKVWESGRQYHSKAYLCNLHVEFEDGRPVHFVREYPNYNSKYVLDWNSGIVGFQRGIPQPPPSTYDHPEYGDAAHSFTFKVWRDGSVVSIGYYNADASKVDEWAGVFEGLTTSTHNIENASSEVNPGGNTGHRSMRDGRG